MAGEPRPGLVRALEAVTKVGHNAGVVVVVSMMLFTVTHVVGRYLLDAPIRGYTEVMSYGLVTMIFLTAAQTEFVKGHIGIDLVVARLRPRTRAVIDLFVYSVSLVVAALLAWHTFVRVPYIYGTGTVSQILRIPAFPFVFIVALGWTVFTLVTLMHLTQSVLRVTKG